MKQMSWNNITPAWAIAGDGVINEYHEGRINLEYAEKKLKDLNAPPGMTSRLYKTNEKED